ncbi:hypothetical protein HID58_070430 [Brassica napus]|uniref:Uncharacterized protein n=1 Tax=Brassica napus TaxID=3708 RepID=A0ABQ7YYR3_BRANA|nr:hypothetical protein HID58_070430 [Brassica napus]
MISKALLYSANASSPLHPDISPETHAYPKCYNVPTLLSSREKGPDDARWEAPTPALSPSLLKKDPHKECLQKETRIINIIRQTLSSRLLSPTSCAPNRGETREIHEGKLLGPATIENRETLSLLLHNLLDQELSAASNFRSPPFRGFATSSTPIDERGPIERNLSTDGGATSATVQLGFLTSAVRSNEDPEESVDSEGLTPDLCFFDLTLPPIEEESRARSGLDFILKI